MVQRAPYQSKILVFVDGKKTMDFLIERLGTTIEGYEFVNIRDYKPNPQIGQLILLTDKDMDELNKFKEVNICFNFDHARSVDSYHSRMALFSGSGKKYSISYITCFNESSASEIKKILSDLDCKTFPDALDKIIEAKAAEASDDDKKIIYDASFNAIKEEKYSFKLPKGKKIEAAPKPVEIGGGFGSTAADSGNAWGAPPA